MGYTESGQSRANQETPRLACNPDLNHAGDCIVGPQSLLGGVEQVHAPGVGITTLLCRQEIAIRRRRIDAGQHGRGALEDLVVQAYPNAGQVLLV